VGGGWAGRCVMGSCMHHGAGHDACMCVCLAGAAVWPCACAGVRHHHHHQCLPAPTPLSCRAVRLQLRTHPVLLGECLGGALYINDFIRLAREVRPLRCTVCVHRVCVLRVVRLLCLMPLSRQVPGLQCERPSLLHGQGSSSEQRQ